MRLLEGFALVVESWNSIGVGCGGTGFIFTDPFELGMAPVFGLFLTVASGFSGQAASFYGFFYGRGIGGFSSHCAFDWAPGLIEAEGTTVAEHQVGRQLPCRNHIPLPDLT